MNYHKFVEWFFDVGEKVLAYVINIFYLTILALPLILVDSVIKESIDLSLIHISEPTRRPG